jgi:plastocyanin
VKRFRSLVAAAVLASLALTAACSDSKSEGGEATTTAAPSGPTITAPDPAKVVDLTGKKTVQITVKDNAYVPRYFKVSPGTKITFTNKGANDHTVHPSKTGAFVAITSPQLTSGKSASITLDAAGDFPFYCKFHGTPTVGQTGYAIVG